MKEIECKIMESRTKNTKRNLISGLGYQIVSIVLPFIVRTAILRIMGAQFSGLTNLFTSIFQVLNLAELGFSSAIIVNMYKPIADNDTEKVCALLNYYRKVYLLVGLFILVVGLILLPWIPKLIKGEYPESINIYLLYLLYLFNTVISYCLFEHKNALLIALQRFDLKNKVYTVTLIIFKLLHLLVIVLTKNVYRYVFLSSCITITNNIIVQFLTQKHFPQYSCRGSVDSEDKKKIKKQVTGLMVIRIGDTARSSLDSIVISSCLGLVALTIYSNYYYIFSAVYGFLTVINNAMLASVGNSISEESVDKNYNDLTKFQFISGGIICACCTCLLCLYQPFMKLWAGEDLMLPFFEMSLFCVYFFVLNSNNIGEIYFTTNGLWWFTKLYTCIEAMGNLLLNIMLVKIWGISGILIATIITLVFLQFIPRTEVLFKEYFKRKPYRYYFATISYGLVTAVSCFIAYFICIHIPVEGLLCFFVRLLICALVAPTVYLLFFIKTNTEKEAISFLKNAFLKSN